MDPTKDTAQEPVERKIEELSTSEDESSEEEITMEEKASTVEAKEIVATEAETETVTDISPKEETLSEEEVQALMEQADALKVEGNALFGAGDWEGAADKYTKAALICPDGRKELAVYSGNLAACDLKREKYDDAVKACDTALKADPTYVKAILRRAQARERMETWTALTRSKEDYEALAQASPQHAVVCAGAIKTLVPRITEAQEREKAEMLDKLKGLGNSILGKFGLSTDNFQFTPNGAGDGGYSMNFKQ